MRQSLTLANRPPSKLLTGPFILACVSYFFSAFSFQILIPVIPLYVLEVGGKESHIGLILGLTALTALLSRPFVGYAADRFGRRPLIIAGPAIYSISAVLYHIAQSIPPLLAVRALNGIGLSANSTGPSIYIADLAPANRRGEAMGLFGATLNLASASAPFIGFWLIKSQGFGSAFLVSAVTAIIGVLLASRLPERWKRDQQQTSERKPALLLISKDALFPSYLAICMTATFGAVGSYLPVLADQEDIGNPGLFFLTYSLAIIGIRVMTGKMSDRLGRGATMIPGMLALAASMILIAISNNIFLFLVAALVYAIGFGAVHPALLAMVVDRARPGQLGATMGTFSGAFDLGIGGGAALFGLVAMATGVRGVFISSAFAPLVGLLILIAYSSRQQVAAPAKVHASSTSGASRRPP